MQQVAPEVGFAHKLIKLSALVKHLQLEMAGLRPAELEESLARCVAFSKVMYSDAWIAGFDLTPFLTELSDLEAQLMVIQRSLEKKRIPVWKKALFQLAAIINDLSALFGFGRLLPQNPRPKALLAASWERAEPQTP